MAKLTATTNEIAELITSFSDGIEADVTNGSLVLSKENLFSLSVGDISLKNFTCKSSKLGDLSIQLNEALINNGEFSADISVERA